MATRLAAVAHRHAPLVAAALANAQRRSVEAAVARTAPCFVRRGALATTWPEFQIARNSGSSCRPSCEELTRRTPSASRSRLQRRDRHGTARCSREPAVSINKGRADSLAIALVLGEAGVVAKRLPVDVFPY